jgi:hypothetical protein
MEEEAKDHRIPALRKALQYKAGMSERTGIPSPTLSPEQLLRNLPRRSKDLKNEFPFLIPFVAITLYPHPSLSFS